MITFFFFEKTIRGESSPDPCFLLVICLFFLTLSTGKQQGHMFKFLGGEMQPLRGTQVKPCCAQVGSRPREHESLEVCLQKRLSWSHVWEMLHPSFPFFGSYNTYCGVKSTEKSCKKDTFYFFPQDDFIIGHSPPNKKASLSPHLPLFFVLFWFFGGVPINSNGAVVSRTFVKRCARPIACRRSTDRFPWLAFYSSNQGLQTYL